MYVFNKSGGTWSQTVKLKASDAQQDDKLGGRTRISGTGNTIVSGAREEDTGVSQAGATYIFTLTNGTWSQTQKIQASDRASWDLFGDSVGISKDGTVICVGAVLEDGGSTDGGSVYAFRGSGGGTTTTTTTIDSRLKVNDTIVATAFEGDGSALTGITSGQWTESSGDIYRSSGFVGIGTPTPGHVLDIQGSQAFDGSTTLRILNPAYQYGRTQLHLVGRYEAANDGWSAGGARNAIMFKSQSSQSSSITNQWTIQSFPNGTNNELGFLAGSDNTPKVVFRGDTGDVSLTNLLNLGTHSSAPSNPVNGSIYYNTETKSLELYKNGWASLTAFAPSDISGLVGWYLPQNWNGSTWVDASGSGNDTTSSAGTIHYSATQSGGGATKSFPILYGDTSTGIDFPTAICPSTYTLIYVTRYYSTQTGRILTSITNNWLSGHWGGKSGLAYHEGWLTQTTSDIHGSNWVLGVDQNYLFRHKSSGVGWSQSTGGGGAYPRLRISRWGSEVSNWQCAEICVYNRHLSSSEYTQVAEYMEKKFGI